MPIIKRYTGKGTVREGDKETARVAYDVVVDREVRDGIPRRSSVYGQITLIDGRLRDRNGQESTLVLNDGRGVDFYFKDIPTGLSKGPYSVWMNSQTVIASQR